MHFARRPPSSNRAARPRPATPTRTSWASCSPEAWVARHRRSPKLGCAHGHPTTGDITVTTTETPPTEQSTAEAAPDEQLDLLSSGAPADPAAAPLDAALAAEASATAPSPLDKLRPASRPHLPDWIVDEAAQAQLDGLATPDQVALLEADEVAWLRSLWRLLERADNALERARQEVRGPERATVLEDLDSECYRIDDAITALTGELPPVDDTPPRNPTPPAVEVPEHLTTGVAQLQLGYQRGFLDHVRPDENGWFYPLGDAAALAEVVSERVGARVEAPVRDPLGRERFACAMREVATEFVPCS